MTQIDLEYIDEETALIIEQGINSNPLIEQGQANLLKVLRSGATLRADCRSPREFSHGLHDFSHRTSQLHYARQWRFADQPSTLSDHSIWEQR